MLNWKLVGNKQKIRHLFFFLAVVVIIIGNGCPVHADESSGAGIDATISSLSTATWDSNQEMPAIWQDRVVWEDRIEMQSDIFFYNITSGKEQRLTITGSAELHPDIFADLVVWEGWSNGSYNIFLYDLANDVTIQVTDDTHDQFNPCVWGDIIAWEDGGSVYYYNVVTGEESQASEPGTPAGKPDVWGNHIVWEQWSGDNPEIMLYNISNRSIHQVTSDPGNQQYPSIWEDRIVWSEDKDGYKQIMLYNITTGNVTNLTSDPWNHEFPVIFGNLVVYERFSDISAIDLTTSEEVLLTEEVLPAPDTPDTPQIQPALWGNRVVWRGVSDGYYDIFLCTLGVSLPPLAADFMANITEGIPPLVVEFTDKSAGEVAGWTWDFGDGEKSHVQNPVHTFAEPEIYPVTLTVHNPWQRSAVRMDGLITVGSPPVPDYSADVLCGPAPLSVQFMDKSNGYPSGWHWDFGDGGNSSVQDPFYTYESPGVYTVSLLAENKWGNGTTEKEDYITVVEGSSHQCILPAEGVGIEYTDAGMHIVLDPGAFGISRFDPLEVRSLVTGIPGPGSGISGIEFISGDETGFYQSGNETIEGNLSGIVLISDDVCSLNRNSSIGLVWDYNFSSFYPEYPPGGAITSTVWEGSTPEDAIRFEEIAIDNHHHVNATAITLLFQSGNIQSSGPATIVAGIDSAWIERYGWRWSHHVDSDPQGAMVYVDSKLVGKTPVDIGEGLSPGNHTVSLVKPGYYGNITTITIGDRRENIRAIRIPDFGEGSFVNTSFLYHDPVSGMDYFRVYSPEGLSKFGIVSVRQEGNIFQLVNLVVSRALSAGGGGGGGGSSGGTPGRAAASAASPPVKEPPGPAPQGTVALPPAAFEGHQAHESTLQPLGAGGGGELPPATPGGEVGSSSKVLPIEGTSSLIVLRSLSLVFVAIFVAVVFYMRWKR